MAERISVEEAMGFDPMDDMEAMNVLIFDSIVPACCDEGCEVEPDGYCPHGHPSVLIAMGII